MKDGFLKILFAFCTISFFPGIAPELSAQENTAFLCSDGIDNDGDGLIDCEDGECETLPFLDCQPYCYDTPPCDVCTGTSYADTLIYYAPGCLDNDVIQNMIENPSGILNYADYNTVLSLGIDGVAIVGFTNNFVINSGTDEDDIFVFEWGQAEGASIRFRPLCESGRQICL